MVWKSKVIMCREVFSFVIVSLQDEFDIYCTTVYPIWISSLSVMFLMKTEVLSAMLFGSIQYWSDMLQKQPKICQKSNSANSHLW